MSAILDPHTRASLLVDVGKGDAAAWREFVNHYGDMIRRWCLRRRLDVDDADDVTQTVLLNLARAMPTFVYDPTRGFRPWLRTVVENALLDLGRKARRRPGDRGSGDSDVRAILQEHADPHAAAVEEVVQEMEERWEHDRRLQAAAKRVRPRVEEKTWDAFWATGVEGRKGTEVAKTLGMALTAVHMAKSRVLRMIKEEVAKDAAGKGDA